MERHRSLKLESVKLAILLGKDLALYVEAVGAAKRRQSRGIFLQGERNSFRPRSGLRAASCPRGRRRDRQIHTITSWEPTLIRNLKRNVLLAKKFQQFRRMLQLVGVDHEGVACIAMGSRYFSEKLLKFI